MIKKLFYILLLVPFLGISQGSLIWETDLNTVQWDGTGNKNLNIWEQNIASLLPFVVLEGNAREGSGCVNLTMQSFEKRNELNIDRLWEPAFQQEIWIGFSFKVVTPLPSSRVFMQIRAINGPDDTVNPIDFRMRSSGEWEIGHATNEALYNVDPLPWGGAGTGHQKTTGLTYTLNQWEDIVIFWIPNSDGNPTDGTMKIWHNGNLILNKVNTTTYYRKTREGNVIQNTFTPKIGPYAGSLARVGEIHYDIYRSWYGTGGNYWDVAYHCEDGIQNNGETGVDCGGECEPCAGPDPDPPNTARKGSRNFKTSSGTLKVITQ